LPFSLPRQPWCISMTRESVAPILLPSFPGPGKGPDSGSTPPATLDLQPVPTVSGPCPAPGPGALDALFAVLVSALAFLLGATPARNSDLWLHLASGRSLVQGQSVRGADPFASTTTGVFWVNHAWLSDAILYELYELGGGRALVIAKSVLVTVLAG